jgi:hypothetical protein
MAAVLLSKPKIKGTVTAKLATADSRASQRTKRACSGRPKAKSKRPDKMGSQMAKLNKYIFLFSAA